jgi:hypothetical protein
LDILGPYFKLRENAFLNAIAENPTPLESVANFILAPSHYLFAGRQFTQITKQENGTYDAEIKQRFDYSGHLSFILTTVSSIILLPISLILGSLAKQLAIYCDPQAKEHHEAMTQIAASMTLRPTSYEDSLRISQIFSNEILTFEENVRGPLSLPEIQLQEIAAFKEIASCLETANIPYWSDAGTALGLYRYKNSEAEEPMIPWDHDIDMAILRQDHENVKRALRRLDPANYRIEDWSSYSRPKSLLRVRLLSTGTVIDLFHFDVDEKKTSLTYNFSHEETYMPEKWKKRERDAVKPHPISNIFPLKRMQYGTDYVRVPGQCKSYLQTLYGENLSPTRVWNEAKKVFELVPDHPYNKAYGDVDEILVRQPKKPSEKDSPV